MSRPSKIFSSLNVCVLVLNFRVALFLFRMELMKGILVQQENIINQLKTAEHGVRNEYQVMITCSFLLGLWLLNLLCQFVTLPR